MYAAAQRRRAVLSPFAVIAVLGIAVAGCDPDIPTDPGGSTAPRITSVTPQAPFAAAAPQRLEIRGERFLTGMSMSIAAPGGAIISVPSSEILALQSASFEVVVVLAAPGNHILTIRNASGDMSEPFVLVVQGTGAESQPLISAVIPGSVIRGPNPQNITVQGTNFAFGLTINVTDPDGQIQQLSGSAIAGFTPTGFQLTMIFSKVGTYSFRVVNPSGESSNTVVVIAGL